MLYGPRNWASLLQMPPDWGGLRPGCGWYHSSQHFCGTPSRFCVHCGQKWPSTDMETTPVTFNTVSCHSLSLSLRALLPTDRYCSTASKMLQTFSCLQQPSDTLTWVIGSMVWWAWSVLTWLFSQYGTQLLNCLLNVVSSAYFVLHKQSY